MFDQIQAAEKAGNLSPEEKKKLEEQAAEKGLQALFKVSLLQPFLFYLFISYLYHILLLQGTKLEIESVLRETCDRVLEDAGITREKAQLRAMALQILGEAYMAVKKEGNGALSEDAEYVKVETKNSRAREGK